MTPSLVLTLVRRVLIAVTLVVVLLVPLRFGERPSPTQVADIEVLVVVDHTRSMAALDYDGQEPRWRGVEADLTALAEELAGARLALMTFGSRVNLDLPFTTDGAAFTTAVGTTIIEDVLYAKGSRADRPLEEIVKTLERAEELDPDRRRFVVFVGDGENTARGEQESYVEVAELIDGGAVLGYGTEEGARMPDADDLSLDDGYVYDYDNYEDAVSRADLDNLETIAEQLDVDFLHRTGPGGMADVAEGFAAEHMVDEDEERPAKYDYAWVAGLVLTVLVLWELLVVWRAAWTASSALRPRTGGRGAR